MGNLKIKESELRELLDEVAADLAKAFESEKDKLVKAEESSSASGSPELSKGSMSASPEGSPVAKEAVEASAGSTGAAHKFDDRQTQDKSKLNNGVKPNPATEKGAKLGKDDLPPEASKSPEASASAGGSPDAGGPPEASESTQAPDGAPSPDGAAPVDPAADPAAGGDMGAPLTPEALQAEYSKLPPEELDMHIKAALAAKAALVGADGGMGAPPGAPPAPGAGAPVPPPPGPSAPLAQAELPPSPEQGKNGGLKLGKSERDELDSLKALVKSQAEDIANLAAAAKKMIEQPIRKAITTVAYVPRVEEQPKQSLENLTKADVHKHLVKLSSQPSLKKADRELITGWYEGRVKVEQLAPLFENYGK